MKRWMRSLLPEFIIGAALTIVVTCFFWGSDNYKNQIVTSDGRGYYAYLPACFIQHDLSFKKTAVEEKQFYGETYIPFYLIEGKDGQTFNKYYPGVAIMQLPFFLIALLIESVSSNNVTGYSLLFLKTFQLGSIFYFTLGFFFLRRFLENVTQNKRIALLTSIFIAVGTNLFFLVIIRTSFSHHLSFCLFAAFSYCVWKYFESGKRKHVIWIGILLGLIVLVRPVNIIIVLAIPLILLRWSNVQTFFQRLFTVRNGHLLFSFISFCLVLGILFVLNFLQTGNIMNWSYHGEGFNFDSPHFWSVLFSYRIGLFVHTPLLLLSLVGLYFLFKKERQALFFWLIYMSIVTYMISSWWSWDYGGFYGNRVFTEHLVFLAVPLAYLFDGFRFRTVVIGVASFFTLFMWSRAYQIKMEITPSRFTQETYFTSLFQMNSGQKNYFAFTGDVKPFGELSLTETIDFDSDLPLTFDENVEFGLTKTYIIPDNHEHKRYHFNIHVNKTVDPTSDLMDVYLIMDWYDTLSTRREYHSMRLYEYFKESPGEPDDLLISTEQYLNPNNELNKVNIFLWNQGKKKFTINDFDIKVDEYSPYSN